MHYKRINSQHPLPHIMHGNYRFHRFCRLDPQQQEAYQNHLYLEIKWNDRAKHILACTQQLNTLSIEFKPEQQENSTLVPTISSISFSHLVFLTLSNMGIYNVQQLYKLSAPNLQVLNLDCNYIVSLRSLRKMNFARLQVLDISGNQIKEGQLINEMQGMQRLTIKLGSQFSTNLVRIIAANPMENLMPLLKKHPQILLVPGKYSLRQSYHVDRFKGMLGQTRQPQPYHRY